jgi:hypothetical protein
MKASNFKGMSANQSRSLPAAGQTDGGLALDGQRTGVGKRGSAGDLFCFS